MAAKAAKRLHREYEEILRNPLDYWDAYPTETDMFHWIAILTGHPDSPYAGKTFAAELTFTEDYPFKPPIFQFKTSIRHRNVSGTGMICIDILKRGNGGAWSPALTVSKILLSISSLIFEPPSVPVSQRLVTQ